MFFLKIKMFHKKCFKYYHFSAQCTLRFLELFHSQTADTVQIIVFKLSNDSAKKKPLSIHVCSHTHQIICTNHRPPLHSSSKMVLTRCVTSQTHLFCPERNLLHRCCCANQVKISKSQTSRTQSSSVQTQSQDPRKPRRRKKGTKSFPTRLPYNNHNRT